MFLLVCFAGYGQQSDKRGFYFMPGVTCNPFLISKSFSAATTYSLQFGKYEHALKGVVRFGIPNYQSPVNSAHEVDYNIKGVYVQPGVILYTDNLSSKKNVMYVGLMGYFSQYTHDLKLIITDSYWGRNELQYSEQSDVYGVMFEFGGLFTLYKNLKATCSMDFGGAWYPKNPIPQIQNFRDQSRVIPGLGSGTTGLLGVNFGIHYVID